MDWILIAAIASYGIYVLFFGKRKGCCGDCAKCTGCTKSKEKTPL